MGDLVSRITLNATGASARETLPVTFAINPDTSTAYLEIPGIEDIEIDGASARKLAKFINRTVVRR
jgi:hypothetical protein